MSNIASLPAVSTDVLGTVLSVNFKHGIPSIIWSEKGIGKLSFLTELAQSAGFHVIDIRSSIMDKAEFSQITDGYKWESAFVKDVNAAREAGHKLAFYFDDLDCATPDAIEAFSKGVIVRKIGDVTMNESDVIIGSHFFDADGNIVDNLILPVLSRVTHYRLGVNVTRTSQATEV